MDPLAEGRIAKELLLLAILENTQSVKEPYLIPDGTQRHEESPVHYAFQVCSESHARVSEFLFDEADQQAEQEQEHAMPEELASFVVRREA